MLRNIVLSAASFIALTAAANAADVYPVGGGYKDGPAYVSVNWTGLYAGINGGYAWNEKNAAMSFAGADTGETTVHGGASLDRSGGFGGGQIGYNWQGILGPRTVVGLEADFQGAGLSTSAKQALVNGGGVNFDGSAKSELDWFGTVRGRLGYTVDNALIYFTGGLAFGSVKDQLTAHVNDYGAADTKGVSSDKTATGYVLGGGVEYKIAPQWSLKGEYQYMNLGSNNLSAVASADSGEDKNTAALKVDHSYHSVRLGLNYQVGSSIEPLK